MKKQFFTTEGIHCSACEGRVTKLLMPLEGVDSVQVNVLRKNMYVTYDENSISLENIIAILAKNGYTAKPDREESASKEMGQDLQELSFAKPKNLIPPMTQEAAKPSCCASQKNTIEPTPFTVVPPAEACAPSVQTMPASLKVSLFFAVLLMYVAMAPMLSLPIFALLDPMKNPFFAACVQGLLCAPILWAHKRIFISGYRAAISGSPNMDTLVGLGSMAAAVFGLYALVRMTLAGGEMIVLLHWSHNLYFDSAGMIVALIGLGKYFENKARGRASDAIDALLRLAPATALVLRDGKEMTIATKDVVKDDILIVHSGQSIAADGIVTQGSAYVDESALTGESLPVEKQAGDKVTGATVSQSGYFQMRVTGVGQETTLARIVRLVDEATASKAPIARLADRISAVFVPIIIGIAILSFVAWLMLGQGLEFAMSIAISVLVISCPCALGLATPTAIMVGMGLGAEKGILFKTAAAIERMQGIDTVVFDKTGTLTLGKPQVTDMLSLDAEKMCEKEMLRLAASVERLSEHPLGNAIVQKAKEQELTLIPRESMTDFTQKIGIGVEAVHEGKRLVVGNARMLMVENISNIPEDLSVKAKTLAAQGKTVLYVLMGKNLLGFIAVADSIKDSSKQAVHDLQKLGLKLFMLTGDNALTSEHVQKTLGIDAAFAEMLPHDKEAKIRELQEKGHLVAMVGDGINDAPALARAHVGIAIGQGTDIAMQSADMVLMQSDIKHVAKAYTLSKATMRTIKQNLFWAFAYNIVLIPLAAGVFYFPLGWTLNPMIAAASMSLSSLTVVSNALRLKTQKDSIFA